jgi:hypothetical protein
MSSSKETRSITSTNLAAGHHHQEEEALKIRPLEEGVGPSMTLPAIEEGVDQA